MKHWLVGEIEKRGHKVDEMKAGSEISRILRKYPQLFHDIISDQKNENGAGFTEVSQSYFSISKDSKIEYSDSTYFFRNIRKSLPELKKLFPNIHEKIKKNKNLAFIVSTLLDSYRGREVGLIYIPGFHRSVYGPFGKDIFPHVIPFLSGSKDNINIEYPGNGFIGMGWDVFDKKNDKEFKETFDAEEYEFLIYLLLKSTGNIETIFAHSLGPIFIIEAIKKLEKIRGFPEKLSKIIFLNPALNQEKLSKFWFIQNYLDTKDKDKLKQNIDSIKEFLESDKLGGMELKEKIILEGNIERFLNTLNKKNSNWFSFLDLFFDKDGNNFILENYPPWKQWKSNNNASYVDYAFDRNFIKTYNSLDPEILLKVRIISLEGYSTVPFDSLRNSETNKGVCTLLESLGLETHYANTEAEVRKLKKILENS